MEVPEPLGHDARPVKVDLLLERFRDQLLSLARLKIRPQLQARIDLSGVVQQTLLEANLSAPPVQIDDSQAVVGWLKRLLARKLIDAMRWPFAIDSQAKVGFARFAGRSAAGVGVALLGRYVAPATLPAFGS
jgi:hypothetical protein